MKCPICGAAELVRDTRDVSYTYKGETTTITDVMADFCPSCGEAVLDREQGDHYSEAVGLFQQRVNALTAETLAKSERGEDIYKAKDYRDQLREIRLEDLRREVQKGIDSGESTALDLEEIKARGRERLAGRTAKG